MICQPLLVLDCRTKRFAAEQTDRQFISRFLRKWIAHYYARVWLAEVVIVVSYRTKLMLTTNRALV